MTEENRRDRDMPAAGTVELQEDQLDTVQGGLIGLLKPPTTSDITFSQNNSIKIGTPTASFGDGGG
jgi:hypothetical protein